MNDEELILSRDLKCPECKKIVRFIGDVEVGCEDCGSHLAVECPKCNERFDSVWGYDNILKFNDLLDSDELNYNQW